MDDLTADIRWDGLLTPFVCFVKWAGNDNSYYPCDYEDTIEHKKTNLRKDLHRGDLLQCGGQTIFRQKLSN